MPFNSLEIPFLSLCFEMRFKNFFVISGFIPCVEMAFVSGKQTRVNIATHHHNENGCDAWNKQSRLWQIKPVLEHQRHFVRFWIICKLFSWPKIELCGTFNISLNKWAHFYYLFPSWNHRSDWIIFCVCLNPYIKSQTASQSIRSGMLSF